MSVVKCALTAGRVVRRADPAQVAALAARQATGRGASVGVVRRYVAPLVVCVTLGGGALALPHMMPVANPPERAATQGTGVVSVPEPPALLVFGGAVLGLMWIARRRS